MKEDADFWLGDIKRSTFGGRGSVGVRAWHSGWSSAAEIFLDEDTPLEWSVRDVQRMTHTIKEKAEQDGVKACLLYVNDRIGVDNDALIKHDLRVVLAMHDSSKRNRRPMLKRRKVPQGRGTTY